MPASIVLRIRGHAPEAAAGHGLLGCVLDLVRRRDSALSAELHANRRLKPFTISPLTLDSAGQSDDGAKLFRLRVTALDDRLADVLAGQPSAHLRIGDAEFDLAEVVTDPERHIWADRVSYERMRETAEVAATGPSAGLTFHTPTAFSSNARNVTSLFPTPELVFRSLGRRWNVYAGSCGTIAAERLDELCAALRVMHYSLTTRSVRLAPHMTTKGFVGTCEYSVGRTTPEQRRLLRLLAGFAFFAGVGLRTTMGMGQVTLAPRHRSVAR